MRLIMFFGMGKLVWKNIKRDISIMKIILREMHGAMEIQGLIMRYMWPLRFLKILILKNLL